MKKYNLEIKITKIEVYPEDDYQGGYSFHYEVKKNGKIWDSNVYEGSYENWTADEWKECLKDEFALSTVLEELANV